MVRIKKEKAEKGYEGLFETLSDGQTIRLQTLPFYFDRSEVKWRNLTALWHVAVMPLPPSCSSVFKEALINS